ncbi:MAG: glycosyltransferase, partial [Gammaproteobacteria bacterium]|nr:glycosyltransferase [Gammaproteobacteria bacterium]
MQLADAAEILPRTAIFTHRRTGSLGPFADWFRYRLLHRYGGIWVDTDVVCLRPFDDAEPIVFGWEDARYVNTAVLGLPAGHPLAAWLAEACEHPNRIHPYDRWPRRLRKLVRRRLLGDRRDRVRWGEYGPKGFTRAVHYFGLLGAAKPVEEFYPVPCAG